MNREVKFENGDWLYVCTTSGKVQAIVAGLGREGSKRPPAMLAMTRAQAVKLRELLDYALAAATGDEWRERPQVMIERTPDDDRCGVCGGVEEHDEECPEMFEARRNAQARLVNMRRR